MPLPRICKWKDCGTILNSYNKDKCCALHKVAWAEKIDAEMLDDFENWLANQDIEDWLFHGQQYGISRANASLGNVEKLGRG